MDFADNISDLYEVSLKLVQGAESNRQSQGYEFKQSANEILPKAKDPKGETLCVCKGESTLYLTVRPPCKKKSVLAELIPLELRKLLIDSDYRR